MTTYFVLVLAVFGR